MLHRDMSRYNILMYPKWGKFTPTDFMENRPPLIEDILAGELRYVIRRSYHLFLLIYAIGTVTRIHIKRAVLSSTSIIQRS